MPSLPVVPLGQRLSGRVTEVATPLLRQLARVESAVLRAEIEQQALDRPVFICGVARSGSTILLEILADCPGLVSHRYADYPPLWLPYWWNWLRSRSVRAIPQATERAHGDRIQVTVESPEAFEEPLWMHFFPQLHAASGDESLTADASNPAFESFFRDHVRKLLRVRNGTRYLSKNNYSLGRIAYLARLFPDARFVIPVREPVAHVGSLVKQHRLFTAASHAQPAVAQHLRRTGHFEFGPQARMVRLGDSAAFAETVACWQRGETAAAYAQQWCAQYGRVLQQMQRDTALAGRCRLVIYERLCSEPRLTLQGLLQHVQAPHDEDLVARWAARLERPTYYADPLDEKQRTAVGDVCAPLWQSLQAAARAQPPGAPGIPSDPVR